MNFELLKKPTFMLIGACNFFAYFAYYIPLFFLPEMAIVNGGLDRLNANRANS